MSQPEASSNRPDSILEALDKNINDAFETLSVRLYKASPGLLVFGNLIQWILCYLRKELAFTHNYIMFNVLIVAHKICFDYFHPPGQSRSSNPSASSTADREL
jgi:hypothetical protein